MSTVFCVQGLQMVVVTPKKANFSFPSSALVKPTAMPFPASLKLTAPPPTPSHSQPKFPLLHISKAAATSDSAAGDDEPPPCPAVDYLDRMRAEILAKYHHKLHAAGPMFTYPYHQLLELLAGDVRKTLLLASMKNMKSPMPLSKLEALLKQAFNRARVRALENGDGSPDGSTK